MKLATRARVLTAALDLGRPRTNGLAHTTVTFEGKFTMSELRRKFRPTTFEFDADGFRFVDKEHGVVASLHGAKMHRTENRFVTFTVELTRLA